MKKVGLTGNIAAGKSEAEKIISDMGFCVFDLDKIVHGFYENDNLIKNSIMQKFATLDRKELAKIVFSDLQKKKELEEIIYPKLKETIFEIFEKYKNEKYIFISGALIFESGFSRYFDKIIFIDAPEELRLERLIKRNNFDEYEAKRRIKAQGDSNKVKSDIIIQNVSDFETLKNNIIKALELL